MIYTCLHKMLRSPKIHNEIDKQVCKQSFWLCNYTLESSQSYFNFTNWFMNFWTSQRTSEVRNISVKS